MTLLILAYLAGVLTIASPCIWPVLPFVLARADAPFRRGGLPMLLGLAFAFAAVASLAAVAGGWAVEANRHGRTVALVLMTLFGLTMLLPGLAARLATPLVALGSRLSQRATAEGATVASSALLGVATGLVWAPCAGPVLGLILTGAALRGPSLETSFLLLAYGLGAATSLAAGVLLGKRLLAAIRPSIRWGEGLRRILGAAVVAGAATIWLGLDTGLLTRLSAASTNAVEQRLVATLQNEEAFRMTSAAHAASPQPLSGPLASLVGTRPWLNTAPLRAEDLRGKVVLVNFWTYSCIYCLRTLPHLRAWAETYRDRGLVVVGVHTPEFAFERDLENVRRATMSLGVGYPVVLDNDFGIWRAFGNRAWPGFYFIGADGRVRHSVLGEGSYDQSERLIRQLLTEADGAPPAGGTGPIIGTGLQAEADARNIRSDETYVGHRLGTNFASPGGARPDVPALYQTPSPLPPNRWGLAGPWTIGSEFATANEASAALSYRFQARDLHLVLAPPSPGQAVRFRVTLDGAPPGADHGFDVDAEGWGVVRDARLYQLVRQAGPVTPRTFRIEFLGAGARAYAFTFG